MELDVLSSEPLVQRKSAVYPKASRLRTKMAEIKGSWRVTIWLGAVLAIAVCCTNIGVLAYVISTFGSANGVSKVFMGSCSKANAITTWADLAVNVLSTLLLSASNNAAQLLCAPTREDMDAAHAQCKWLEIGVTSVRNLLNISRWRAMLWTILLLSSVPLHLLYNTVIFMNVPLKAAQECSVYVNTTTLTVVILCNVVKIICLIATACWPFQPLATIGDAIASFCDKPDAASSGAGALSWAQARDQWHPLQLGQIPRAWEPNAFERKPRRWATSVSTARWLLCVGMSAALLIAGLVLLAIGIESLQVVGGTALIWSQGLSKFGSRNRFDTITGQGPTANAFIANLPQVALSFAYLLYNNVLTCMLLSYEYTKFASVRSTLRVSRPAGRQRSTLWLQIPMKYGGPVMLGMAFLHWLVSRSFFYVQGNQLADGTRNSYECGYSLLADILAICLGSLLVLALVAMSFRKLDPGMPLVGSCSIAIAAACANQEDRQATLEPLKYGVIADREADEHGRQRVGFSNREVEPLVDGVVYV